jgi:hypothetical protein
MEKLKVIRRNIRNKSENLYFLIFGQNKENILFITAPKRDHENISIVSTPLFFCTYFEVLSEIPQLPF